MAAQLDDEHNLYQVGPHADVWIASEAERLQTMDEFLAPIAEADLSPAFQYVRQASGFDYAPAFLDVGAGSGGTTEAICEQQSAEYYALDVNADLLGARSTDSSRIILAKGTAIPFPAGSFDITHSRAVIGWNTNDASRMVAEQLRVTADRGVAVFSEFDWSQVGPGDDSDAIPALMRAQAIMLFSLCRAGFEPNYGSKLAEVVEGVTAQYPGDYQIAVTRHELPSGDYRALFLDAAQNVAMQLDAASRAGKGEAGMVSGVLKQCMEKIGDAGHISIRMPALVTTTVYAGRLRVHGNPDF